MDLTGLLRGFRLSLQVLGHRGSRLVVDASQVVKAKDPSSGLQFFPINGVFTDSQTVLLGFGRPNVYMVVPRPVGSAKGPGWDKFAAFMFWRKPAMVANTKGRVQAGILFELRDVPAEAVQALREQMQRLAGKRTASCANANAKVLTAAGFTCGGRSLRWTYRPSKLAAKLWQHGLEYKGQPVPLRIVQTDAMVADHFVAVWRKELTSLCRMVQQKLTGQTVAAPAPVFSDVAVSEAPGHDWPDSGPQASIGISRPSLLGAHLGFILGERPIFDAALEVAPEVPELSSPLRPFPGKLDRLTKVKKFILFSRPAVALIRRHLVATIERHEGIPMRSVVDMLQLSPGPDRSTAFVYNLVLTSKDVRITRLENRNGRDHKFINWIMAKHVLVSGYAKDVLFPGEAWCYQDESGRRVLCLNDNSGTYKPGPERLTAAAAYLQGVFGMPVQACADRPIS